MYFRLSFSVKLRFLSLCSFISFSINHCANWSLTQVIKHLVFDQGYGSFKTVLSNFTTPSCVVECYPPKCQHSVLSHPDFSIVYLVWYFPTLPFVGTFVSCSNYLSFSVAFQWNVTNVADLMQWCMHLLEFALIHWYWYILAIILKKRTIYLCYKSVRAAIGR